MHMESMEWSKDKTLKLIELLQMNPSIWNPSLCDSRRNKQKRKDELVAIAHILGISVADSTKKIQHLRTQYNRESAREARAIVEEPNEGYVSNWYAFEYLHFMKDSTKPYRVLDTHERHDNASIPCIQTENTTDCKLLNHSPPHKISRTEVLHSVKPELPYQSPPRNNRDEFSVFGEYIANELRTLKGEKNLLVAKKKIQDVIFDVKMGMIAEHRTEPEVCTVYSHASHATPTSIHSNKLYTSPALITTAHIEPLSSTHTSPTSQISEIIINSACHYSNFKVDNQ